MAFSKWIAKKRMPFSAWTFFCLMSLLFGCGAADVLPYKDPSLAIESRVDDLLSRMTLAEKIGQMTQIERSVADPSVMQNYFIGSILSGGGSAPSPFASPSAWADMVDYFQTAALSTRLGIPMIYGIDAVHGHNNVYGATIFPHNIGLGATRDANLVQRIGVATALEVRGTGIPYVFAPCIAVSRDPRWGRCYESYSEDPALVQQMTQIVSGLQGVPPEGYPQGLPYVAGGSNVVACAKHYVGDGGTTGGVDESNTEVSFNELRRIHFPPYYNAIAASVSTIMISYSSWNGVKMSANEFLITTTLKEKLGFQGFTISDWEALERITTPPGSNYSYSVYVALNAGLDMVMVPINYQQFIGLVTDQVSSGFISIDRINDAVRRILRVKFASGLFEHPMADRTLFGMVGNQDHRNLAREAVRKSLVLLKNGKDSSNPALPLNKYVPKILVAGKHANDIGLQCGGWTITWQGSSGNVTVGTTILDGIKNTVSASTQVDYLESPDPGFVANGGYSYAVVVIGEPPYTEMFGDNDNLSIPQDGIVTMQNVCGAVECVVVLISGRPLVVEPYLSVMNAFVAAWLPGSEGQGVADVLFGDYDFQGKLPRTWFKTVDQLPMNVGDDKYNPLFSYNFGLTTGVGKTG
ncbi:hypothetical protein GOP47_0005177 [Adiantum capillus-veneris]|uniref:beta-glucosidase n=1 Tax=Adiantum capillus-veneris TaxID=13818 RepID=A0A9D4V5R5_ADICA|nr:hypothetical protein GOP47_0005177 [Adiantum capillus-veneris]